MKELLKNIEKNSVDLKHFSHIGVGTISDIYFPTSVQDVATLYRYKKKIYPIAGGSNILFKEKRNYSLFSDKRMEKVFYIKGDKVIVSSSKDINSTVNSLAKAGFGGLEFLYGIPAHIGGLTFMNASAFGFQIADLIDFVDIICSDGEAKRLSKKDCNFAYRKSDIIGFITRVGFNLKSNDFKQIIDTRDYYFNKRVKTQPLNSKNIGSIFKNIPSEKPVAFLIEKCGLKGKRVGGAKISSKHSNFIINDKNATYFDVKSLIKQVKNEVYKKMGIELTLEIKVL